jgi:hemolysin III
MCSLNFEAQVMEQDLGERQEHSLEEVLNTLTHGLGAVLSAVGLIALLVASISMDDVWRTLSFSIFGSSLITLYLASTLYHAARCPLKKSKLKVFDHCAIYLLIAGSYTPFLLVSMRETGVWGMFVLIWGIAFLGIFLKLRFKHRFKIMRVATYLVMGWLVVLTGDDLLASVPEGGLFLLALGGVIYTLGVIFYLGKRIPYNHAIWHMFVLGGSTCHFFSVYFYVLPADLVV